VTSGPRELSDLCPLIEDSLLQKSYITSVYLIIEGGNSVPCEPKTYTNVQIVSLAGCTMAKSETVFQLLAEEESPREGRGNFMI